MIIIRKRYAYDSHEFSKGVDFTIRKGAKDRVLNPEVVSMTKQEFGKEADINFIVARARVRGFMTDPARASGAMSFGDFTTVPDYMTQQNRLAGLREDFQRLPSKVRLRFDNNPALLIEFLHDPKNSDEAIELGLRPKPKPAPAPAPVPAPAASAAAASAPVPTGTGSVVTPGTGV